MFLLFNYFALDHFKFIIKIKFCCVYKFNFYDFLAKNPILVIVLFINRTSATFTVIIIKFCSLLLINCLIRIKFNREYFPLLEMINQEIITLNYLLLTEICHYFASGLEVSMKRP